jgi:acyl carrier protein
MSLISTNIDREELSKWLCELFEEPLENITPETSREDIPGWDSLGVLVLMANLDEKFGIVLTENEITDLKCVGDIFQLIENNARK